MWLVRVCAGLLLVACKRDGAAEVPQAGAGPGVAPEVSASEVSKPEVAEPGLDGDGDGLVDAADRCPDVAEIFNYIEDGDGCADEVPQEVLALAGPIVGLRFDMDKATLRPGSFELLDRIVVAVKKYPEVRIEVVGHMDGTMPPTYSAGPLSGRRARAVRDYLVEHGVDAGRVVVRDAEASEPIAGSKTSDDRVKNGRIELAVLPFASE